MGDRCTGRCCKRFFLPMSMDELQAEYAKVTRWRDEGFPQDSENRTRFRPEELEKIALMVVPVEVVEAPDGYKKHYFTCKHHDATTGDCLDYQNRPLMCSDFPYGKPCEHGDKCEWDAAREGLHPPRIEESTEPVYRSLPRRAAKLAVIA